MLLALINLFGCSILNDSNADQITEALQKKYGEKFKVTGLGNRLGTATNDTVTSYVYAENKPDVLFEAEVNTKGELTFDNYVERRVTRQVEDIIRKSFQDQSLEALANVHIYGPTGAKPTNPDITLEEYVKSHKPELFIAQIILKNPTGDLKASAASIMQAYQNIYANLYGTGLEGKVKVIAAEQYADCAEKFREEVSVTKTWYEDFKVMSEFSVSVTGAGVNKSESELESLIKGGK
ncbi:hypothetical protein [Ectobacillus ponti]|uniref:Uncharacterized protein n=1 Tax=Ectobacillus ponti TaxID=2961894 RepID=A0AA41XAJ7_9BACI|nr:hypothetical protein [Ectobacillus ponti]MCP8969375.1 hypothetical protein [Ectobacillus ponti]